MSMGPKTYSLIALLCAGVVITAWKLGAFESEHSATDSDGRREPASIPTGTKASRPNSDSGTTAQPSLLTETHEGSELFPRGPLQEKLDLAYGLLETPGARAEQTLNETLESLREHPQETMNALEEAYSRLDRLRGHERYKLVYMTGQLRLSEAQPFLTEIASEPVPDELPPYEGDGTIDAVENEVLVRMGAIGGLYRLAEQNQPGVRESLLEIATTTDDPTLRGDSIRAYLSSSKNPDEDLDRLKVTLEENQHHLLNVQTSDVTQQSLAE